jgi:hypothetical protein
MTECSIRRRDLLSIALLSLVPARISASDTTRTLTGFVHGRDRKPIAGAVVMLKNLVTLQIRSFISLKDGSYRFTGLNPDIGYEVHATYQGAASDTKTLSRFDSAKEASVDLTLK